MDNLETNLVRDYWKKYFPDSENISDSVFSKYENVSCLIWIRAIYELSCSKNIRNPLGAIQFMLRQNVTAGREFKPAPDENQTQINNPEPDKPKVKQFFYEVIDSFNGFDYDSILITDKSPEEFEEAFEKQHFKKWRLKNEF